VNDKTEKMISRCGYQIKKSLAVARWKMTQQERRRLDTANVLFRVLVAEVRTKNIRAG
jgi:hypothetical protein